LRTEISAKIDNSSQNFEINFVEKNKLLIINQNEFESILNESNFNQDDLNEIILHNDSENKVYDAVKFMIISLKKFLNWQLFQILNIKIETKIPIGSGLGSSGSLAVGLASIFLIFTNNILINETKLDFTPTDLDLINKHAFFIEKIFHGNPSGIDNTVSTFGNYLIYKKGQDIESFKSKQNLNILVVNSCVPKKTLEQVVKVRMLYNKHETIIEPLLDAVENLVDKFILILKNNENNSKDLNDLVSINQGILTSLSVSNLELNKIIEIANLFGYSAKITGAGGGGCCYVLLNNSLDLNLNMMIEELKKFNFLPFQVCLGDFGVKIENVQF
jgi:mevalonate kinase